jgi:16S rRNA (guanine(527)-N(7))-methyltransferase RsmG
MSISPLAAFAEGLRRRLRGIAELNAGQIETLHAHYELLLRWNPRLNLTRITSLDEALERHYAESIFLAAQLPAGVWKITDIGSGAGFPGFPLAVVRPECEVTLIESHQRKAVFLREVARGVSNIKVRASRAEEVDEVFDWVVSRAVSISDLEDVAVSLGGNAALLGGPEDLSRLPGFEWQSLPMPWGRQRYVHLGLFSRDTK